MTPKELKTFFEGLVDDSHDVTHTYQLMALTKNKIERREKPPMLLDVNSSKSRSAGDTYLSTKDLPSDFREMIELYVGTTRYSQIPFVDRIRFKDAAHRFYIDHKNSKFGICGTAGASETIHQHYLIKTTDPSESNEDNSIFVWPSDFHPLIAFEMAGLHGGIIDPDTIANVKARNSLGYYQDLLAAFRDWIHDQKLAAMDHRGGFGPEEPTLEEDLSQM